MRRRCAALLSGTRPLSCGSRSPEIGRDIARMQAISDCRGLADSLQDSPSVGVQCSLIPPAALRAQFPAVPAARRPQSRVPRIRNAPHRKRARLARPERTCRNADILGTCRICRYPIACTMYPSLCLRPNGWVSISMDAGILWRARRRRISDSPPTISLGSRAREKSTVAESERSGTSNRNPCARI